MNLGNGGSTIGWGGGDTGKNSTIEAMKARMAAHRERRRARGSLDDTDKKELEVERHGKELAEKGAALEELEADLKKEALRIQGQIDQLKIDQQDLEVQKEAIRQQKLKLQEASDKLDLEVDHFAIEKDSFEDEKATEKANLEAEKVQIGIQKAQLALEKGEVEAMRKEAFSNLATEKAQLEAEKQQIGIEMAQLAAEKAEVEAWREEVFANQEALCTDLEMLELDQQNVQLEKARNHQFKSDLYKQWREMEVNIKQIQMDLDQFVKIASGDQEQNGGHRLENPPPPGTRPPVRRLFQN